MALGYGLRAGARPVAPGQANGAAWGAFYEHDGKSLVQCGSYSGYVAVLFGKVWWTRPTGRRVAKLERIEDLPVDREIGLTGGFSLSVTERICRLS